MPAERRHAVDPVVREPLEAAAVVVGRAFQVREPEEALANPALLEREVQDRPVQRDEHGICAIAGRHPASGFVSVISYNFAVAKFMDCWSSA